MLDDNLMIPLKPNGLCLVSTWLQSAFLFLCVWDTNIKMGLMVAIYPTCFFVPYTCRFIWCLEWLICHTMTRNNWALGENKTVAFWWVSWCLLAITSVLIYHHTIFDLLSFNKTHTHTHQCMVFDFVLVGWITSTLGFNYPSLIDHPLKGHG